MGKERYFIVRDAAVPMPQEWHEWDGCPVLTLVAGEEHKTIASLQRVWDFLMENGATRSDIVVNIGGGYISDIGGMAAATYRRGMRYINVPTTLLAMVDASVGGKTGINYRGMKNYVGVFHAPEEVRLYPHFLRTLPNRELLSGFAELLKTALLDSEQFAGDAMAWLEDWSEHGWTTDLSERLEELIRRAVACKERYVASDPYKEANGLITFRKDFDNDARIFGLGENVKGINKRGSHFKSFNFDDSTINEGRTNLYASHNFFIVSCKMNSFGVFIDTPKLVNYDFCFSSYNEIEFSTYDGFDLYIIESNDLYPEISIIERFREMIGKSYIAPFFSSF